MMHTEFKVVQLKDGSYAVRVTHSWVPAADTSDGRVGAGLSRS